MLITGASGVALEVCPWTIDDKKTDEEPVCARIASAAADPRLFHPRSENEIQAS